MTFTWLEIILILIITFKIGFVSGALFVQNITKDKKGE